MPLSRRQFLQVSGATIGAALLRKTYAVEPQPSLPIPPLLESKRGQPLFLTLQEANWAFLQKKKALVWGINGQYLGPTVRVQNDEDTKIVYSNKLNEPVAMSVSGLQIPGPLMGGARRVIASGTDWSPVIPIRQAACTCWYHASSPNHMAQHIYNGLAGLWLVEDKISRSLPIPNHYAVDDFPLIIQDKRFSTFGTPEYVTPPSGGFLGDTLLTNGAVDPYIDVSRSWVRLRLLNASNSRRYLLQLSDGRPLYVIASDLGFLPTPVPVQQLSLAPGERREVLINMSQGDEVVLTAGESAGVVEKLRGLFEPSDRLTSTNVLTLRPTGLLPLITDNPPTQLINSWTNDSKTIRTREFLLGDKTAGINGALWDLSRIDVQARLETWERWKIRSDYPQSFHIQGVMFLIKKINGVSPFKEDQGWKDTVWIDGEVELLVFFNQPTNQQFPFLFYSHALELADRGSTGQLTIEA